MEERYGEFVLYDPQMSIENLGLWFGPFIVIILAILMAVNTIKKHSEKYWLSPEQIKIKQEYTHIYLRSYEIKFYTQKY